MKMDFSGNNFYTRNRYNSSHINLVEDIEDFTSDNLDDVLDIYDELKYRFAYIFLEKLRSTNLTSFIMDYLFTPTKLNTTIDNTLVYNHFKKLYKYEISVSYSLVAKIFRQYRCDLSYEIWSIFCYRYSNKNFEE